jgi:predicted O-methyltransferase YrrM
MGQIVPAPVEEYLARLNRLPDSQLEEMARTGAEQDLPLIDAEVGGLLRVLATAIGATRVLEIGTAIGYSGIWLAGALPPGGMLITMEMDPERASAARELIFQDGDKRLYPIMLDRLVALLRPGGLLITDNVLWSGEVVPGFVEKPERPLRDTRSIADYNERLAAHPDLLTAIVPLRDGVAISVKKR